jgi:HAE1 family hydrophobic/amphiphilic exporter-1
MNLTQISIKRPSLIIVVFGLLTLGGIFCFKYLGYELLPSITTPTITVTTIYPGAAPGEVENQVTKKIEDALSGLNNVDNLMSKSIDNVSIVIVNFNVGTNIDLILQEAQREIDQIKKDLPSETLAPMLSKVSPNDLPVMTLTATSNMPEYVFYQKVRDVFLPQLQQIKGVAEITLLGGEKREIRVNINNDKLKFYKLSILQVTQAINMANLEFPTGKVKDPFEQLTVKLAGKFTSVDDIKNLVVFTPPMGTPIRVSDIAEVKDGLRETESISRYNGKSGIGISIKKSFDANNVEISRQVQEKLKLIESENKEYNVKFVIADDTSIITLKSVNAVLKDLMIAVLLVTIIMLLFLHSFRNAINVMISIPVSLISAFVMMYFFNFSLNIMTLLGMTLVVGILVDNSIVVLENIQRHLDMGKDKITAIIDSVKEITFAVISITLVIIVVFLPLTFLKATVAAALIQFSYTVAFSTAVSLLVSLTLTPWLSSLFSRVEHLNPQNPYQLILIKFEKGLKNLTNFYTKSLDWSLSHKMVLISMIVILFAATAWMMSLGIIGQEMFAAGDQGKIRMTFEFSKNTTIAQNNLVMQRIEQYIMSKPEIESVFANVGGPKTGFGSTGFGLENESELTIQLKPQEERMKIPTEKYMINLRKELEQKFTGIKYTSTIVGILGFAYPPIQITLTGDNYEDVFSAGRHLKSIIERIPGAIDTKLSIEEKGNPELRINMDREKMAIFGLSTAIVGATIQNALSGNHDSKYRESGTDYDIRIMMDAFDRKNPDDIKNIGFINNMGQQVQLSQFADVFRSVGPSLLERRDRRTSITVSSYNLGRGSGTLANDIKEALKTDPLKQSITKHWDGDIKLQDESFGSLGIAMIVALIIIYFVLVVLYDNFIYPFIILFSIPVALIGALLALNLALSSISIFSIFGMLMLFGLVSKNAILLVDFANQLKAKGMHYREAIIEAGRIRLRPILMTTIAMVVGMIPVAIAKGADAEWKNGLAWVLIGGLISSMILSVFLIPMLYYIADRAKEKFSRKKVPVSLGAHLEESLSG